MTADLSSVKKKAENLEIPFFLDAGYIPSLDGIRAFSIFFVIIAHLNFKLQNPYVGNIFMGGVLGVRFFFVISGFLITSLLLKEKIESNDISLKKFYIRRFLRILPVYLLCILVIFILDQIFSLNIAGRFYAYVLTFTENFDQEKHWYTRHFWSLSVEEQFYLIFPFIIKKSLKFYIRLSIVLLLLTPVISFLQFHPQYIHTPVMITAVGWLYIFFTPGLITILTGSLAAIALFKFRLKLPASIPFLVVFQIVAIFLIWFFDKSPSFVAGLLRDVLIVIFLISVISFKNSFFYKLLNIPLLKIIGVLSYSIYIWQQLFVNEQPWANSFKYGGSMLFNLPLLIIVSYLSYHYFEKPFLKLKSRFGATKSAHQPVI